MAKLGGKAWGNSDFEAWESYLGSQEDDFSGIDEEVIPGVM